MSTCIPHPKDDLVIVIRGWQLEFCDGDNCAAGLLSYFEHWHNVILAQRTQNGTQCTQNETLAKNPPLQFHTLNSMWRELKIFGKGRIFRGIHILEKKGAISIHHNPKEGTWLDRTNYYEFHPEVIIEWLKIRKTTGDSNSENSGPTPVLDFPISTTARKRNVSINYITKSNLNRSPLNGKRLDDVFLPVGGNPDVSKVKNEKDVKGSDIISKTPENLEMLKAMIKKVENQITCLIEMLAILKNLPVASVNSAEIKSLPVASMNSAEIKSLPVASVNSTGSKTIPNTPNTPGTPEEIKPLEPQNNSQTTTAEIKPITQEPSNNTKPIIPGTLFLKWNTWEGDLEGLRKKVRSVAAIKIVPEALDKHFNRIFDYVMKEQAYARRKHGDNHDRRNLFDFYVQFFRVRYITRSFSMWGYDAFCAYVAELGKQTFFRPTERPVALALYYAVRSVEERMDEMKISIWRYAEWFVRRLVEERGRPLCLELLTSEAVIQEFAQVVKRCHSTEQAAA